MNLPSIKEVAEVFVDYGYFVSDYGVMQYNIYQRCFEDVSDNELLRIFDKLYPNLERRVLNADMIKEHLPIISDKEFDVYELCCSVVNYSVDNKRLNQDIQKIVEYNNNRKKDIPGIIKATDYTNCIQHLINNDIYTDKTILYEYKNNTFEVFGITRINQLFKDNIIDKMDINEVTRIALIGLNDLTYINEVSEDLEHKKLLDNISSSDWQIYEKINQLINNIKVH